jgi:hypothetical protein
MYFPLAVRRINLFEEIVTGDDFKYDAVPSRKVQSLKLQKKGWQNLKSDLADMLL